MSLDLHQRLKAAAAACAGMEYGTGSNVRFPDIGTTVPGIPPSLVRSDPKHIDCSSFTAWMLLNAYRGKLHDPVQLYRDLQIMGPDFWSPVVGVVRESIGVEVSVPPPGRWCLVQLWRTDRTSGHAVLVRQETDGLWVWESKQGRGPGLRVTTWSRLTRARDARLAVLEEV